MGDLFWLNTSDTSPAAGPLWREAVGDALRQRRTERGERLSDVAQRAGLSAQYLSEIERGLKDPSSEMLHAVAGALELPVSTLARRAASTIDGSLSVSALAAA